MHAVNLAAVGPIEFAVPVWATAIALVVVLIIAWAFGGVARWTLRDRAKMNVTTSIVLSIVGTAIGLLIAGALDSNLKLWSGLTVILGLVGSIAAVFTYTAVIARVHPPRATLTELMAAGESDRLEFKSTARVNMHTGEKDARMEHVIVKTVSGFLNSGGGTLLIGVDDDGRPLGLDRDYATLKVPDADRFELWLRDLFSTSFGQNAAAAIGVTIEDVAADDGQRPVCRIICSPSTRPVYLRPGKKADPEFWVRSGNSTRQLTIDEAAEYIMSRWPLGAGSAIAAQVRAAVRFSIDR
ncbi:ATP-binding protein [Gordonia sp. Z-3]|uniref:ATP-binding protein n=1 Tax=Gordonia sp. Z-3 TaxID=3115408 RepID=UPI002E2B78E5|nr:ATP-binding protein [Gordonia sp. Z-3]MED5802382.1 ATP-binding protein [Gordonia sp. Z-3]